MVALHGIEGGRRFHHTDYSRHMYIMVAKCSHISLAWQASLTISHGNAVAESMGSLLMQLFSVMTECHWMKQPHKL